MNQQTRKIGLTISAIKEMVAQLKLDKTCAVVGLKSPDLYLRMIEAEGVQAEAEEMFKDKVSTGFVFKLKR